MHASSRPCLYSLPRSFLLVDKSSLQTQLPTPRGSPAKGSQLLANRPSVGMTIILVMDQRDKGSKQAPSAQAQTRNAVHAVHGT